MATADITEVDSQLADLECQVTKTMASILKARRKGSLGTFGSETRLEKIYKLCAKLKPLLTSDIRCSDCQCGNNARDSGISNCSGRDSGLDDHNRLQGSNEVSQNLEDRFDRILSQAVQVTESEKSEETSSKTVSNC